MFLIRFVCFGIIYVISLIYALKKIFLLIVYTLLGISAFFFNNLMKFDI